MRQNNQRQISLQKPEEIKRDKIVKCVAKFISVEYCNRDTTLKQLYDDVDLALKQEGL